MSLDLRRRAELSTDQVTVLSQALATFYKNPPASYYAIANQAANRYTPGELPFHCDLVARVTPGSTVLEVGCGTAHLCQYVEEKGGHYAGIDYSKDLLQQNRRRFPNAQFFEIGSQLDNSFDLVASLYALEHVADPPAYLESLWQLCRPGGLIGIICPEFIENGGIAPSVFFGKTPKRFFKKLSKFRLMDAFSHWVDLKIRAPRWEKKALTASPGAFWINLSPRVLHGADYSVDADAVHLPRLKDILWFFEKKGADSVQTSAQMPWVSAAVLRFNCYALIRKPVLPSQ